MLRRVPFGGKAGICGKTDCDRRDAASGRNQHSGIQECSAADFGQPVCLEKDLCELENCPEIKDGGRIL